MVDPSLLACKVVRIYDYDYHVLQFYGSVNDFLDLCYIISCDLAIDLICIIHVLVIITLEYVI